MTITKFYPQRNLGRTRKWPIKKNWMLLCNQCTNKINVHTKTGFVNYWLLLKMIPKEWTVLQPNVQLFILMLLVSFTDYFSFKLRYNIKVHFVTNMYSFLNPRYLLYRSLPILYTGQISVNVSMWTLISVRNFLNTRWVKNFALFW